MKVKNLNQYKTIIAKRPVDQVLGLTDGAVFERLVGEDKDIDNYIGNISNFAEHSNTQLFYELLQNASDAKADTCYIRFNTQGFLVLNNGEPFVADGNTELPGRLRSFLSKNSGAKFKSSEAIGEHGQGSKLLYDLFLPTVLDTSDHMSKAERLNHWIQRELSGLILFSWSQRTDLLALMNWDGGQPGTGSCLNSEVPLLTKTINTYYPASVEEQCAIGGTNRNLFPITELEEFVQFLKESMTAPEVNSPGFDQGVAIYVRLGEGRAEKLQEALEEDLAAGLSTSLALLPHVKRIQINEKIVEQDTGFSKKELELYPATDAHRQKVAWFYYPASPEKMDGRLANFFKYFPITKEIYGLKFILNSKEFQINTSRQNFNFDDEGNQQILARIGETLVDYIDELGKNNIRKELLQVIKAVLKTNLNLLGQNPRSGNFIKQHFFTNLLEAIQQNIPTTEGIKYLEFGGVKVVRKASQLPVSNNGLGDEVYWLDEELGELAEELENHLDIPSWSIVEIYDQFETPEQWRNWVNRLSTEDYALLLEELSNAPASKLKRLPFVRFSDGVVYSLHDTLENDQIVLLDQRTLPFKQIFDRQQIVYGGESLLQHEDISQSIHAHYLDDDKLIKRLVNLIDFTTLNRDEKWLLFSTWCDPWELPTSTLREEIHLFQNDQGELRPLSALVKNHINHARSGILKPFQIDPSEIRFEELDEYFLEEDEIWAVIRQRWNEVASRLTANNYGQALNDLEDLFSQNQRHQLEEDQAWILTQDGGLATSEEVFFNDKISALSTEEYERLCQFTERLTSLELVHVDYFSIIGEQSFAPIQNIGLSSWADKLEEGSDSVSVSREELQVLNQCRTANERFFTALKILPSAGEGFYLLAEEAGKQFYTKDQKVAEFLAQPPGYYELPEGLFPMLQNDLGLIGDFGSRSEEFVRHLLDQFRSEPCFIDLVERSSQQTQLQYLNGIGEINLTASDQVRSYRNRYEGKLITLAVGLGKEDIIREKANIDGRPFSEYAHEERVRVPYGDDVAEFQLSTLLPQYMGVSDTWQAVRDKLRGVRVGDLFSLEDMALYDIAIGIGELPKITHPDQVAFFVVYQQTEEFDPDCGPFAENLDWEHIEPVAVLDALYNKQIMRLGEVLGEALFVPVKCIHAPGKYTFVLPEENLPSWAIQWLGEDQRRLAYLEENGLRNGETPVIQFREKLHRGDRIKDELAQEVAKNLSWANLSFHWFKQSPVAAFGYQDGVYSSLKKLMREFIQEHKGLPELLMAFDFSSTELDSLGLSLEEPRESSYYLAEFDSAELRIWGKVSEQEEGQLFFDGTLNQTFRDLLNEKGILKAWLKKEFTPDKEANTQEWEALPYRKWKEEHNKYSISVTEDEIPFTYHFAWQESVRLVDVFRVGQAARHVTDDRKIELIVHLENLVEASVLYAIKLHKDELFPSDSRALVALLEEFSLELDDDERSMLDTLKQQNLSKEDIHDFVSVVGRENLAAIKNLGLPPEELIGRLTGGPEEDGYDLGKELSENEVEQLRSLMDKLDEEKLEAIVRNLDKIMQLLEAEDDESTPSTLIGYIGEVLVEEWLRLKHGDAAVKNKAVETVNGRLQITYEPFDLELLFGDETFLIDVKTTIKPIGELEKTVAFFISRSQYEFIAAAKPGSKYFIYRISLQELGLYDFYQSLTVQPGQESEEVINQYHDQILAKVRSYLRVPANRDNLKRRRMAFQVIIPRLEEAPF